MDRMKRIWQALPVLLGAVLLTFLLGSCRARTNGAGAQNDRLSGKAAAVSNVSGGKTDGAENMAAADRTPDGEASSGETDADRPDRTREKRDAERREYDDSAAVEIVEGTGRTLYTEGDKEGMAAEDAQAASSAPKLDEAAAETATQIVGADSSDRMGVSPDADEADSAAVYYTVLLRDRLGTLFECKRMTAYLEMPDDHVTVYRTSPEHRLLTEAGVYDASGRLLEQNLRVDDGWVVRKDPDLIVKVVDGSVLGRGVSGLSAARAIRERLVSREGWRNMQAVRKGRVLLISAELLEAPYLRTAAVLMIAREAYPALFDDVDTDEALRRLAEEATGMAPTGVYVLPGQGGETP